MKEIKKVEIPLELSSYIEKCWFEWEGILKIIGYITQNNACIEHLNYYTSLALEKNYILEKAKSEAISEYIRLDSQFEYKFDFDNSSILYWEV